MSPANPQSVDLLSALRHRFVDHLQERRKVITNARQLCELGQVSTEQFSELKREAHKLAGSGGTYGFPKISESAQALELALESQVPDPLSFRPLIDALLDTCDAAEAAVHAEPRAAEPEPVSVQVKHTVLVVDDDETVRALIAKLLSDSIKVIEAGDVAAGQAVLAQTRPDLILLDDDMPGPNGRDLLAALKTTPDLAEIPVVMLTSANNASAIAAFIAAGVTGYLAKPFDPEALKQRVESILHRQDTTVLIVDDDLSVGELLRHKFQTMGFRVLLAGDGQQALGAAAKTKVDLAILDRMMPGMDGLEVLRALRAQPGLRDLPILMLTAKRRPEDVVHGLEEGANDYVIKPFAPDEVVMRGVRLLRPAGGLQ